MTCPMTRIFTDSGHAMYAQANALIWKFGICSVQVKATLLKTYSIPMYTANLWRRYRRRSMLKPYVAYNDGVRLQLKVPHWSNASQLLVSLDVFTCSTVLPNLMCRCMCRLSNYV